MTRPAPRNSLRELVSGPPVIRARKPGPADDARELLAMCGLTPEESS